MNKRRLILRSLRFYRRTNLGVALGAALAATVLIGALMVGDSVRYSLTEMTLSRLGGSDFVLAAQERFFVADLAERMGKGEVVHTAALLLLNGVALSPEGDRRVNDVQVVGVSDDFWKLAPKPLAPPLLESGACLINGALADRLGLTDPGGGIVLRLRKPGSLPADLTLATREEDSWSRRMRVVGIQDAQSFGHFTLKVTQSPTPTVFLPLSWLSEQLDIAGRANVLLLQSGDSLETATTLQARLNACWRLDDAGIRLHALADGSVELLSDQVFIAPFVAEAAFGAAGDVRPVITYFINRIASGERATPYSFASASGQPRVPDTLKDHEVLINDWLAEDLGVTSGSPVTLSYYAVDSGGRLEEKAETFTVAGIVQTAAVAADDRGLAPAIPGLSDAANCRDWDPGIPIDLNSIRDQDEAYWNAYGPLPKLYLTRTAAERLWRNRFGVYTSLRFPGANGETAKVAESVRRALSAQELGFVIHSAKAAGLAASRDGVDFGQLFIGLSFFLIVAAILLTALLFAFNVQQRAAETGTLRALGFLPRTVGALLMAEGLVLVVAGAAVGACFAVGYNAAILRALETVWRDAVRTSSFQMHLRPVSLLSGGATVVLAAAVSMAWAIRKQTRATIRELHQREPEAGLNVRRSARRSFLAGTAVLLAARALARAVPAGQGQEAAGAFFASGFLVLTGVLTLLCGGGELLQEAAGRQALSGVRLALRGTVLRRGRSLACIALVALGSFLVVAVAANRRGPVRNPSDRASGTGGYTLWGKTTLPLVYDLNSVRGQSRYRLSPETLEGAVFTPLRLREGDDASCLNLNRVATPHLLGVDPEQLDQRGACTFAQLAPGTDPAHPWRMLSSDLGPDTVPAIGDLSDIVWSLGKAVGDTLTYTDEAGQAFKVKLVAGLAPSIFQGHLIVAEGHLVERFPSLGGARVLLVDAPPDRIAQLERALTMRLSDLGLACTPTARRLAEFSSVENTYLAIFMVLGGLGVLLGSAGLGVVAARNILERRAEMALLRAVGFRRCHLRLQIFAEHGVLAVIGIGVGALAAGVAMTPAMLSPGATVPWLGLSLTLGIVFAGSLLWIGLAVHAATRGSLITALRNE